MTKNEIFVPTDHGFIFTLDGQSFDFRPMVEDDEFHLHFSKPDTYQILHREDGITLRDKKNVLIFKLISVEEKGIRLEIKTL